MTGLPAGPGTRALIALVAMLAGAPAAAQTSDDAGTRTPIKHVLLIIGENRSFDHLFGLFRPGPGQSVWNLLSQGVLNADGSPGPNFARARQWQASATGLYSIHPPKSAPFAALNTRRAPKRSAVQPLIGMNTARLNR